MRIDGWANYRTLMTVVWLLVVGLGVSAMPSRAADLFSSGPPLPPNLLASTPTALQPWIDWVLRDRPDRRCPVSYDAPDQRQCLWLTSLRLVLDARGGEFSQQVYNDRESWLTLPGDRQHWPREVRLDEQVVPVLERDERPAIKALPGSHRISGRFAWRSLPESIRVPPQNALLDLSIDGRPVQVMRLEEDGVLWLRQQPTEPAQQDNLDIQVFRLLTDGIPFVIETQLDLRVSGQAREALLGPVLPPDFLPLALKSPLPARLEPDGRLRVQLRPGTWTVQLSARHRGPVETLARPAALEPWPVQEVWSFQAQNRLRVAQVEGVPALDPAQTRLPDGWRQWPAYLVQPDDTLRLVTRTRGDTEATPGRLTLERSLWLDFAGDGYTVQDRLSGNLGATRLEASPALRLGRVEVNGENQFITQIAGTKVAGVEVRQLNNLQLVADSRLEPAVVGDLPAVGWQLAPQSIKTTLHLPPGWRLLAASGPDTASNAWLYSWNLFKLFIMLVVAIGFARLWNWGWGVIALVGMALCFHEPNVPLYVWLNVLAAIALLRLLPPGSMRTLVDLYRRLALVTLLIIGTLFAIQQVRSALHPQLEPFHWSFLFGAGHEQRGSFSQTVNDMAYGNNAQSPNVIAKDERAKRQLKQYTPDIKVQTGPGLPAWNWQQSILRWNGPVAADERLKLWLLPPWGTRILMGVGLVLLLAMVGRVLTEGWRKKAPAVLPPRGPQGEVPVTPSGASAQAGRVTLGVLLLLLLVSFLSVSPVAHAQMPSPDLLKQLRDRLTEPPDCQRCGDLAALALTIKGDDVTLRLSLHAQVDTAVPLPLPREGLIVRAVELDGVPAALFRDQAHLLWLRLPAGLHELTIVAVAAESVSTLQLPLPMVPGQMDLAVEGWLVEGYVEGRADQQLQLTRQRQTAATPLQAGVMPPFVQVEREIVLDVDWQVETRVRRLSQADSAAVVEIPLLPGERITTPDIRVRDDRVLLNLPPGEADVVWQATLTPSDAIALKAVERDDVIEIWRLRTGPLWHVQTAGIPLVSRLNAEGEWLPEWRPWPGEEVKLTIGRPEGIPGNTATIDRSELRLNPGRRLSEATLEMMIRASRGAEQTVTLPVGAVLTQVQINEVQQPIQQRGQQVVVPLTPGVQRVNLVWRTQQGIAWRYTTPEVHLGGPSVNSTLSVHLPRDRWVLWAGGPVMGPAVLFWAMLLVLGIGAVVLGRMKTTPLRTHHWFLLGIGLSQSTVLGIVVVVGWLLLLGWRKSLPDSQTGALKFNLLQMTLVVLALVAALILLDATRQGLLGPPDMQIAGYGSSAWQLNWYQDRLNGPLPQAWVISVPMLLYRGLMLAWALWLALAVLRWLGWAWSCFSAGGLWRKRPVRQAALEMPAESVNTERVEPEPSAAS